MTTIGYIKQKQQRKKQKRKRKPKQSPVRDAAIPASVQVEEKTNPSSGISTQHENDDFENRKKQAQVALESLAFAAEAHLLL